VDGLLEVADDSLARFLRSWYGEPDRMAVAAVLEAIMGAQHVLYRDSLSGSAHAALLAPLRAMPMPGPTVGAQLYAGDGLLAFSGPLDASAADGWLYLAALTDDGLRYAHDVA
jgi:hypothetical protein